MAFPPRDLAMHRRPSPLFGLLACLVASSALGQVPAAGMIQFQPLPELDAFTAQPPPGPEAPSPATPAPTVPSPATPSPLIAGEAATDDVPMELKPSLEAAKPIPLDGFLGYRYDSSSTDWMVGKNDQFGMLSLKWDHYEAAGVHSGLGAGVQVHFLDGPVVTDMPARLYDFTLGYQSRDRLGAFSYDAAVAVTASSDFARSARKGIRFPSHAVGFLTLNPGTDLVFGVDYLDRADVKLLPVFGLITSPNPNIRIEAVFPRPRVVFQLTSENQLYLSGELGGGTWEIERLTGDNDLATYRDLRVCLGLQHQESDRGFTALEIGYLFDRRLEYTSGQGNYRPDDTALIRLVRTY